MQTDPTRVVRKNLTVSVVDFLRQYERTESEKAQITEADLIIKALILNRGYAYVYEGMGTL